MLTYQKVERVSGAQKRVGGFGTVSVPGNKAGAIVTLGLVIIAWIAIPVARIFILGTCGLGLLVGLFLGWLHNREG
jgi:hypothetical protein